MPVTEPEAVMPQAVITDDMIASMAAKAGSVLRIDHSVNNELASRIAVTKFAGGIGDINPLWTDQDYAANSPFGAPLAPPSFIIGCFSGIQFGWPGLGSFHSQSRISSERRRRGPDREPGHGRATILRHGRPEQQKHWLPRLYSGQQIACQLFSEPDAGSDLAAVRTRAVRDGDCWRISGQKVWTSGAHLADIGEIICRTADGPRHRSATRWATPRSAGQGSCRRSG
jgi:hypothetical protein